MGRSFLADIPGNFFVAQLGSTAAIASNGGDAILTAAAFVAPANVKILSAWKVALGGTEVTKGTATTSASYRRTNLINGGASGTGTTIMASLNNTASGAQYGSKAFATTASNTMSAGEIALISHLSVGAATADGTDMAQSTFYAAYQLL